MKQFLFKRYTSIMMIQIKSTWIIVEYLKCLTYCSWYNYAYIFFRHHNFINVSIRTIIETKLVICFYFGVSRMVKLRHLLTMLISFTYLDYGSYSIWWSNYYRVIMQDWYLWEFLQYMYVWGILSYSTLIINWKHPISPFYSSH